MPPPVTATHPSRLGRLSITLLTIDGMLEVKECHHTLQAFQGEDGCTALPRHPGILRWTSQTVGGQLTAQLANLKPSLQQLSQSLATFWHPVALGLHQAYSDEAPLAPSGVWYVTSRALHGGPALKTPPRL